MEPEDKVQKKMVDLFLDWEQSMQKYQDLLEDFNEAALDDELKEKINCARCVDYWVVGTIVYLDGVSVGIIGHCPADEKTIRIMKYDSTFLVEMEEGTKKTYRQTFTGSY